MANRGEKLLSYLADYVVFDLETTGVSCHTDQVVEISAIKVKDHQVVEEFTSLVNPGCPIPYYATQVNGITDDMVADAPAFEQVLGDFLRFIGDLPLVGHNIHKFDMLFIYRDCEKFFGEAPGNDYVDTLSLSCACLPELKNHKLTDLAAYYGIATEGAHRALNDCRMNQQVYEFLGKRLTEHPTELNVCPKCGKELVKRKGKFGWFWGCASFPACRYTKNIS